MVDLEAVEAVRRMLDERFSQDHRVNGVGLGRGQNGPVVRVHLVNGEDRPDLEDEINGVPIQQVVVGRVVAL